MVSDPVVAGIDVGGNRKGCHLVVLQGDRVLLTDKGSPEHVAESAIASGARMVGIDAPCRWGLSGFGRTAEKQLAKERIFCFSTPTREKALSSTSGFYGWMLNGERVYQKLTVTHPLLETLNFSLGTSCFETFPHAITCALLGTDQASAKLKRTQRRQLLEEIGIDTHLLKSIDALDAALCALTAQYLILGCCKTFGDAPSGLIVVPTPRTGNHGDEFDK
jgi:predicted nuclease with RNAse H fold